MDSDRPRDPEPMTKEQLERSLRAIRIAIAVTVVAISAMMIFAVAVLDAPAIPVLPITAFVVVTDLVFVIWWGRRQQGLIRRAELREAGLDPAERR